jgi:hypothetical protein
MAKSEPSREDVRHHFRRLFRAPRSLTKNHCQAPGCPGADSSDDARSQGRFNPGKNRRHKAFEFARPDAMQLCCTVVPILRCKLLMLATALSAAQPKARGAHLEQREAWPPGPPPDSTHHSATIN